MYQNRIRELRKEQRMTQLRLAMELDVSQETVSSYEHQKHYPSFTQLVRMSEIFHAAIDYIMGLSDVRMPESRAQATGEQRRKLEGITKRLSERQLELVAAYAQGVLDDSL